MSSRNPAPPTAVPTTRDSAAQPLRQVCAYAPVVLALLLLAATFFLISPPRGETYPGAKPWTGMSVLRPLTELMSLGGWAATERGAEIKDLVLHLAAGTSLLLLGLCLWCGVPAAARSKAATLVFYAQVLLAAWVALSLLSSLWSGAPEFSRGQALLYAMGLALAVGLGQTLPRRLLPALLTGWLVITALAGGLAIWYWVERNPFHRASFPVGNPTSLAAALLPALVLACVLLGGGIVARLRRPGTAWPVEVWAALVAIGPLLGALYLTRSRGATLALLVALALVVYLVIGRRLRWALVGGLGLLAVVGGAWWFSASHLDVAMARGGAMRFRLYAWRYAALFWATSPFVGHGAGTYPRIAGQLSWRERDLDPAAFMGEIIEHPHNELFEVLTEIGLVGGVTYVAGMLAVFVAVLPLLRGGRLDWRERCWLLGLVGGLGALVADSMVGVAMRLPGGAAIFYLTLAALWAATRQLGAAPEPAAGRMRLRGWRRPLGVGLCVLAAIGIYWVAVDNWRGVLGEYRSAVLLRQGQPRAALAEVQSAAPRLLDPVRKVVARKRVLECAFEVAAAEFRRWQGEAFQSPEPEAREAALDAAARAFQVAVQLRRDVPALTHSDQAAARAAEMLAELYAEHDRAQALEWREQAARAWRRQHERTRFDPETLLALTRYPASLETHLGLLRDALRFGAPTGFWENQLRQLAARPEFDVVLRLLLETIEPVTPQTDLDTLIASRAPEVHRLVGVLHALRGEYAPAAARAARAAALYRPMRPRFPRLHSVALAEEADYRFRATPEQPAAALELIRAAIAMLPRIQEQKYAEMAQPFRIRLAMYLLTAGEHDAAIAELQAALGVDGDDPELVEQYLQRMVFGLRSMGVSAERLTAINAVLCRDYPTFCES